MSDNLKPRCPRCTAEQMDWLLCGNCTSRLKAQLLALPGLLRELHITLTRQSRMGGSGKINERPLPFDVAASEVTDVARMTLSTWVRELDFGDTTNLADNPRAWCLWMSDRMERIRGHQAAEEIADEIDHLTKIVKQAIDRPADLEFVGKCGICESDLYAKQGSVEGYCRKCKAEGVTTTYNPGEKRDEILAQLEHRWGTVTECTRILLNYGLEVSVQTIKDWRRPNKHGIVKLAERGVNSEGHSLYRFGDVMDLAKERVEQGKRRRMAS